MRVELRIVFDGTEPGLAEHRLSLSAFAEPLRRLLAAVQRTGSSIVSQALEPDYGARGGKFAKEAALLDLELATIERGSATPVLVATARPSGRQMSLINDLPARTIQRIVNDIEAERQGKLQNITVRRYLSSLPAGVTRQSYCAVVDGTVVATSEFAAANITVPKLAPRLCQIAGHIVAAGFEPGTPSITIKHGGRTIRCNATAPLVEHAISLRGGEVTAAVVESADVSTLIWVRPYSHDFEPPGLDSTVEYLNERWGATLRALAQ